MGAEQNRETRMAAFLALILIISTAYGSQFDSDETNMEIQAVEEKPTKPERTLKVTRSTKAKIMKMPSGVEHDVDDPQGQYYHSLSAETHEKPDPMFEEGNSEQPKDFDFEENIPPASGPIRKRREDKQLQQTSPILLASSSMTERHPVSSNADKGKPSAALIRRPRKTDSYYDVDNDSEVLQNLKILRTKRKNKADDDDDLDEEDEDFELELKAVEDKKNDKEREKIERKLDRLSDPVIRKRRQSFDELGDDDSNDYDLFRTRRQSSASAGSDNDLSDDIGEAFDLLSYRKRREAIELGNNSNSDSNQTTTLYQMPRAPTLLRVKLSKDPSQNIHQDHAHTFTHGLPHAGNPQQDNKSNVVESDFAPPTEINPESRDEGHAHLLPAIPIEVAQLRSDIHEQADSLQIMTEQKDSNNTAPTVPTQHRLEGPGSKGDSSKQPDLGDHFHFSEDSSVSRPSIVLMGRQSREADDNTIVSTDPQELVMRRQKRLDLIYPYAIGVKDVPHIRRPRQKSPDHIKAANYINLNNGRSTIRNAIAEMLTTMTDEDSEVGLFKRKRKSLTTTAGDVMDRTSLQRNYTLRDVKRKMATDSGDREEKNVDGFNTRHNQSKPLHRAGNKKEKSLFRSLVLQAITQASDGQMYKHIPTTKERWEHFFKRLQNRTSNGSTIHADVSSANATWRTEMNETAKLPLIAPDARNETIKTERGSENSISNALDPLTLERTNTAAGEKDKEEANHDFKDQNLKQATDTGLKHQEFNSQQHTQQKQGYKVEQMKLLETLQSDDKKTFENVAMDKASNGVRTTLRIFLSGNNLDIIDQDLGRILKESFFNNYLGNARDTVSKQQQGQSQGQGQAARPMRSNAKQREETMTHATHSRQDKLEDESRDDNTTVSNTNGNKNQTLDVTMVEAANKEKHPVYDVINTAAREIRKSRDIENDILQTLFQDDVYARNSEKDAEIDNEMLLTTDDLRGKRSKNSFKTFNDYDESDKDGQIVARREKQPVASIQYNDDMQGKRRESAVGRNHSRNNSEKKKSAAEHKAGQGEITHGINLEKIRKSFGTTKNEDLLAFALSSLSMFSALNSSRHIPGIATQRRVSSDLKDDKLKGNSNNIIWSINVARDNSGGRIVKIKGTVMQRLVDDNKPENTYTSWSEWSSCTTTCGPGRRHRTRSCQQGLCTSWKIEETSCDQKPCTA